MKFGFKNISDKTIATAVFDVVFYDYENNIMDTVRKSIYELTPGASSGLNASSRIILTEIQDYARSYSVTLIKTTTVDVEKVLLKKSKVKKLASGEEELSGTLKNISEVITDVVVAANFFDKNGQEIGTEIIEIKDIEPGAMREFRMIFTPLEGDVLSDYDIEIGEMSKAAIS